jgi:arabinofuranan 3-O-arabinosyltransferase
MWFSPGRFVANGDTSMMVRDSLASEVTQFWSHQSTGAGSTSVPIQQLVEVLLLHGVRLVGLDDPTGQWLLYALLHGLCAFGAAYLAAGWVRHPLAAAAGGLLAVFNAYVLCWLVNPLPSLAIGLTGLLTGMAVRAAAGRRVSPIGFAAASLPASYLALNPPWLAMAVLTVLFVVVGAGVVGGWPAMRRCFAMMLKASPWVLLLNLWWIVPTALQLLAPAGMEFSAAIDVREWSWTHLGGSIENVVTLRGMWIWSAGEVLPYARALNSWPREALAWVLPGLALVGALLAGIGLGGRRRRRAALLAAGVTLVLLFLSTGLRSARFGWVNLWLFDHVPGMWLIREPFSKLGVPIVLLYAALAALAIDFAIDRAPWPRRVQAPWQRLTRVPWPRRVAGSRQLRPVLASMALRVTAAGAVLAALAYASPMLTGSAVPAQARGEIPSFRVAIPAAWHRLADTVNADPGTGKVLMFPINLGIYSVTTNWDYHGVDVIPAQLLMRPTLHLLPGGYYRELAPVETLIVRAQDALLSGDTQMFLGAIAALGVDTVIVRHDLQPAPSEMPKSADPDALVRALAGVGNVRPVGQFGVATLYRIASGVGVVSTGSRLVGVHGIDAASVAGAVAALPAGDVGVTEPHQQVAAFHGDLTDSGTMTFSLGAGVPVRIDQTGQAARYRTTVAENRLVLTDANTVAIDGRPLPIRPPSKIHLTEPDVVGIDIDGELRPYTAGGDVVVSNPNSTLTAYGRASGRGLTGGFRPAANCDGTDSGEPGVNPLRMSVGSGLRCAAAPVKPTAGAVYTVRFSYRGAGDAVVGACLWQEGTKDCAPLPTLPAAGPNWTDFSAITRMGPQPGRAWLYLFVKASGGSAQAEFRDAEFRDVEVTPARPVGHAILSPSPVPAADLTLSAGQHTVTVNSSTVASSPPQFRTCDVPGSDLPGYPRSRLRPQADGSLELDAQSSGACAEAPTVAVAPGATYRMSFDYRSDYGTTPRVCVRQLPTGLCALTPDLTRVAAWQSLDTLIRPLSGTTSMRPLIQENANAMVKGRVAIRNFSLTRVAPVSVRVSPVNSAALGRPALTYAVESSSAYRVKVANATGRFVLVLAESHDPGWALHGLPVGWSARHILANGYANGWLIEGTGDADLTIQYGPERWTFAALVTSLLAGVAAAGVIGYRLVGPARRRRWLDRLLSPVRAKVSKRRSMRA